MKPLIKNREKRGKTKKPAWQRRICGELEHIRTNIGVLTQYQRTTPSEKVKRSANIIISKYRSEQNPSKIEIVDLLKQKHAAESVNEFITKR